MAARSMEELGDDYTTAAFYIEKELHQEVGQDYSVTKFFIAMEELSKHNKKEEQASSTSGSSTFR